MNQTVTVNIRGIVFHIEVDAYEELKKYLNKIRSYFKNAEECDEIMTDIEARIAELFNEKITSDNQVISAKDVDEVITIMGKPEQYLDEDEINEEQNYSSASNYRTAKKLFRNPDDRMIGGVASGIASYFGIDAIWLRLFFVIALFVGFGFLLYIILWMVIPEAKTASDKLQMKGDPVNIDNIGKTFKEEAEKVSENLKKNGKQYGKKAETVFEAFFGFLLHIFKGIFKALGKIVGAIFLFVGTVGFISFVLWITVGNDTIFSFTDDGVFAAVKSNEFFNLIFSSNNQYQLFAIGLFLTIVIPLFILIYAGVKLLFKVKTHYSVGLSLFILWVFGILTCGFIGLTTAKDQRITSKTSKNITLPSAQEYFIKSIDEEMPGTPILEGFELDFSISDSIVYSNDVYFTIKESDGNVASIEFKKQAKGFSKKDATEKAKAINYNYTISDSIISLTNYINFNQTDKIRSQKIVITLYLPKNKTVQLDNSLNNIIYDIDNVTDTYDNDMLEQKWVMLKEGLTCLDCDEIEGVTSAELDSRRAVTPIVEEVK